MEKQGGLPPCFLFREAYVMKQVTAIVLGAGARGNVYARYAKKTAGQFAVVGVAEPNEARRQRFAEEYHVPQENVCASWEPLLERPRMADVCIICTLDQMHTAPAVKALALGYHVLLEKPMATTEAECRMIAEAAETSGCVLSVCHVLRYTPFYSKIKEIVSSGKVGQIMCIQQTEHVGYWHQAHSFVRGNWADSESGSPMILQKCCHDLDIISWLADSRCARVSSFGSLTHFKPEHAPKGAPLHCLDGCPAAERCPYYAPRFYLEHPRAAEDGFVDVLTTDHSRIGILRALQNGPYGRCVYHCGNNVVDHQTVTMEFENSVVASLVMTAFTADCHRTIEIMGTMGELTGDMEANIITVQPFLDKRPTVLRIDAQDAPGYHHGGGDRQLIQDFVQAVQEGDGKHNRTSARQSLQSHLMCFAAERARIEHKVVEL